MRQVVQVGQEDTTYSVDTGVGQVSRNELL